MIQRVDRTEMSQIACQMYDMLAGKENTYLMTKGKVFETFLMLNSETKALQGPAMYTKNES